MGGGPQARRRSGLASPARHSGFTLIELMIVVVIVAILASIAYPAYKNQVQQTRRSDGKAALAETAQRLERCYTATGSYQDSSCAVVNSLGGSITSEEGYYQVTTSKALTDATFELQATPQKGQADDKCGTLTLDEAGQRGDGAASVDCW